MKFHNKNKLKFTQPTIRTRHQEKNVIMSSLLETGDVAIGMGAAGTSSWKSAMDLVLASVLMVLAAPAMLAAMVLVRLTSRGPAIYCQTRLGHGGRPFTIYKIRTMRRDCERTTGAIWSMPGDPRVTPIGRILR